MNRLNSDFDQSLNPDKDSTQFFFSPSKQQLYQQLITDFQEKKLLMMLTGESGLGKTFLIEHIVNELDERTWVIKVYLQRESTCSEFFDVIARELEVDLSLESTLTEKGSRLIWHMRTLPDQHFVILVDQAQSINPEELERIIEWMVLITAEEDYAPFIHLVFLGLPMLNDLFDMVGLEELDVSKISRHQIIPLKYSEIKDYIHFYLKRVEKDVKLFKKSALEGIAYYSNGSPKLINKLCDLSLLTASLDDHPYVTLDVVHDVADNCLGKQIRPTLAKIKEKIWGGFIGPALPESELASVEAFLADFKVSNETEVDNPENNKDVTIFVKIKQALTQFTKAELIQKGFVLGVIGGVLVGVVAIVIINKMGLHNQTTQLEGQTVNLSQSQQAMSKAQTSGETEISAHEEQQDIQQQFPPVIVVGGGNQELDVSKKVDLGVNVESNQSGKLTQNLTGFQINEELSEASLKSNVIISDEVSLEKLQTAGTFERLDFAKQVEVNQDIIRLLSLADQQFEKKQLMTPFEDSAWQTFQDILRLDPYNQDALAGINKIKKTYISWAWIEIQKKNFRQGENLFKKALLISKDDVEATSGLVWLYKYHKKKGYIE